MNNKGFIQFITVLLILASAYQLSFTFVTNSVEKTASSQAESMYPNSTVQKDKNCFITSRINVSKFNCPKR